MMGTLYGVSLGPGDPGLITRRAWQLLQQPNIHWTYPIKKKNSPSYALQIALRADLVEPEKSSPLIFPMTHDKAILAKYWLQAADSVVNILRQGHDVAFLVEGDASTFSTFQHLAKTVKALDAKTKIDIIPGVSSFNAAARAQLPLADSDDTIAIIPAGYGIEMIESLLNDFDTLILLKVKPILDDIIDLLEDKGLLDNSCFMEKTGAPEERIVHDVKTLRGEKVNYLSLIMIYNNQHRVRGEMIRGCRKKTVS